MFNWLGNLFPYSDLHSLNLDWILSKMKETATQAAKAIADSANALAQVIEAKTAAQNAQTAAQNAQTAANNAQTAANNAADSAENAVAVAQAAKSAAQTAQNTADAANSAAQTAQSTAQTAQTAAQNAQNTAETAQSAAETAQSAADTANTKVSTLEKKFPVSPYDLETRKSYLYKVTAGLTPAKFPENGSASIDQIVAGIVSTNSRFLTNLNSQYLQLQMNITEAGATASNTVFDCSIPVVGYTQVVNAEGVMVIAPITVIKKETNDMYNGSIKISRVIDGNSYYPKCQVIFATEPPFNANTGFVISVNALGALLDPDF